MTEQAEGLLGSSALIPEDNYYLHNQRLGLITDLDEKKLDKKFLYYLFNLRDVRNQIRATATGAKIRHTAPERILNVRFKYLSIEVQRHIAAILSAYDDLIENNTRRIQILEEMARRIYEEWFVRFRFPGHENVSMVESELGLVPESWNAKTLIDVCEITMGQSPPSDYYNEKGEGLPFHQGVADFGERFPVDKKFCTVKNRLADADDILFSVRAPVGRINISTKQIIIGRGLSAIRSKHGHQEFIFQQLKDRFQEEDIIGNGAIFKSVTKEDVQNIKLLIPQAETLKTFGSTVKPIFRQIKILTNKTFNLRRTRDLLLPKLISGEIDVSNFPEPVSL
jgi:type I restriction enzyme S subunit